VGWGCLLTGLGGGGVGTFWGCDRGFGGSSFVGGVRRGVGVGGRFPFLFLG